MARRQGVKRVPNKAKSRSSMDSPDDEIADQPRKKVRWEREVEDSGVGISKDESDEDSSDTEEAGGPSKVSNLHIMPEFVGLNIAIHSSALQLLVFSNFFHFEECVRLCSTYAYSGRIGCAYYDPVQCKIFVLEDTEERAPYDLMAIRSVTFAIRHGWYN